MSDAATDQVAPTGTGTGAAADAGAPAPALVGDASAVTRAYRRVTARTRKPAEAGAHEPPGAPSAVAVGARWLDALGLPCEGAVAAVSRALHAGEPVRLVVEVPQPLPPLHAPAEGDGNGNGDSDGDGDGDGCDCGCCGCDCGALTIRVTDRAVRPAGREVLLRPPSLVVGVGASRGVPVEEVFGLVEETLRGAGLAAASVAALATVDTKGAEPGIVGAAERLGVPVVTYPAGRLASVTVPNPSRAPLAASGTPSVAEAAALLEGGELLVPKRKSSARPAMATCAVVRRPARGRAAGPDPGADRFPHAPGES